MSQSKVITSFNALSNNIDLEVNNNVVCIDVINNRIGVKQAQPAYEVDVSGTIKTNYLQIGVKQAQPAYEVDVSGTIKTNYLKISKVNDISFENLAQKNSDVSFGYLDICGNLLVKGDVLFTNGTYRVDSEEISSDDRLKHNEIIINNGLEIINQLVPKRYDKTRTFKDINYNGIINEPYIVEAGLIAQEVEKINDLSFTVRVGDANTSYYLNYNNIFVYLIAAVKEIASDVKNILTNKNVNIQNTNNTNNDNTNNDNTKINNITKILNNQNMLINTLNSKISMLEKKINNLEKH